MTAGDAFELALLERISRHAPVNLDQLAAVFPGHTWNQVFAAVDRLSRRDVITLRRVDRHTYLITLGPSDAARRATTPARPASFRSMAS